jgi:hypothetical protein
MLPIRPEVTLFLHAAENLLSPGFFRLPLNGDERGMIQHYLETVTKQLATDLLMCESIRLSAHRA